MSHTDWPGQAGGAPAGAPGSGWSTALRLGILLLILIALGWVLLIASEYFRTGKPISELPAVPAPLEDLFDSTTYRYVTSLDGIEAPMGVAVGLGNRVYVTETDARQIRIFDGVEMREIATFSPPDSDTADRVPIYLAVNPSGDVYVSDRAAATIFVFSPDGTPKGEVAVPDGIEEWHPLGLTFDAEGNLYVADVTPEKHRILVLDTEGNLKLNFGTYGEERGQFAYPNGIAVDSQGRIFVTDSNNGRVQAFDRDGNFLFLISRGMGSGDLAMPRGIAFDNEGRLLVVDSTRASIQAYRVSDSGISSEDAPVEFKGAFYGDSSRLISFLFPNGIAVDDERVYVAERGNNRVSIWEY